MQYNTSKVRIDTSTLPNIPLIAKPPSTMRLQICIAKIYTTISIPVFIIYKFHSRSPSIKLSSITFLRSALVSLNNIT